MDTMHLVIRTTVFLAGALVLANFGVVDALPISNIDVIADIAEEAGSEEGLLTIPVATTTRASLFHRRQMALRDFIRSRTLTTKAPVRIKPLLFPVRRNTNGSTVYLLDSFNSQNKEETVFQIRPDLTKPTEIPPELLAKFPIMSNRNHFNDYEFNRVPATSPAEKYEKYSFQDLMRILKGNDTVAGEQLRTANISFDGLFGYSGENDFSLEPMGKAAKGVSWEPLKEAVLQFLQAPASGKLSFDANSTESIELPGEISTESDEFFEPNKETSTTVEELEVTSAESTTDSGIKESTSTTDEELKISSAETTTDSREKESTKVEELKISSSESATKDSVKKESTTEISLDSILNLNFWELLKDTPLPLMPTASTAAVEVSTEPVTI
ncbi:hypothetical protein DAPPUDRAFT_98802 [Daphnia pulex]|uniref:Uncharacterized protein n=1 Tax=Daphnia pulex TaxID=6669 RepID=E9G4E4_DAPPU|nr:hypothetical protein DAPPUDRAFT_98802 [Daphnia pulex]|eukprot:EFX85570.1 hypothetical protein DAPPUDRAFT_98802 [Daphnia pulex]